MRSAASGRREVVRGIGRGLLSALVGLGCVLGALAPGRAAASELTWDGPAECAAREQLLFAVERALGAPLATSGELHFAVRVERGESLSSARLRVSGAAGSDAKERLLVAPDCSRLVDTLAVAITLALGASEALAASEPTAPASRVPASAPPSAAPMQEEPVPDVLDPEASAGLEAHAFLSIIGDGGSLPRPALGIGAGLTLGWPRLALRASGTLFLAQQTQLEPAGSLGAELSLALGALLMCTNALAVESALSLPLCAGAELGQMWGTGIGVAEIREASMVWAAPRTDAGLLWALPGTRLRLGGLLSLAVPLNRDLFVLDEIGTVHRPSRVVGRIALSLELRI